MALDFPSSPGVGQVVTVGGVTWTWDGVKWTAGGTGTGIYVPLTGGTMTGDLILNRDAQVPLGAATFEQVNARGAGDNRLINGDMRIDQRNGGVQGTATGYTIDRWQYAASQSSKGAWQRGSPAAAIGFPNCLNFGSTSAYAPLAGDYFAFLQTIEADAISDFSWGQANAQSVTLSFWVASSLTGTFGGCVKNPAGTRAYGFTYSLPNANVWTKCVVTIPGDTAGTWVMSGNAGGATINFGLGVGSTFAAPVGAWSNGNYVSAAGVNVVATNGASFFLTGVKLEIGSVATPYNRQSLAKSMADCQRYYSIGQVIFAGYAVAANPLYITVNLPVSMRATPTMIPTATSVINGTGLASGAYNGTSVYFNISVTATAQTQLGCTYTAAAEL